MINNQTSQYELLNTIFYLSRLGIFQYVRDILQFTVSLDHPVTSTSTATEPLPAITPPLRTVGWIAKTQLID